ncbi:hypothetical protein EJ110_NYTH31667 [Nymphaea thermarum]|nr:hypothetical protein EJ110_NYTH31667 [Nymphaea thermarum]
MEKLVSAKKATLHLPTLIEHLLTSGLTIFVFDFVYRKLETTVEFEDGLMEAIFCCELPYMFSN